MKIFVKTMAIPLPLIALALILFLLSVPTPVSAASGSFTEPCDTFDTAKWSFYWNKPIVQGGTWVMPYAVGDNRNYQANYRADSGYGTYEIRMKIDGTRLAGINWWIFVYGHYPDYSANQMELDFAEIWHHNAGETSHPIGEYSISFWVNGTSSTMGKGYWYLNTIDRVGINFEDGAYHSFKYVYSASDLIFYLDGTKVWQWSVDCTDKTALGMPIPPMQFMIGCGSRAVPALEAWKMTIDSITYTDTASSESIPAPAPTPISPGGTGTGTGTGGDSLPSPSNATSANADPIVILQQLGSGLFGSLSGAFAPIAAALSNVLFIAASMIVGSSALAVGLLASKIGGDRRKSRKAKHHVHSQARTRARSKKGGSRRGRR